MATYSFDSDLASDQDLALGDSTKLVRDGTRLTGNVQMAVARYEAAGVYETGDAITVSLGIIPAGVRIIPSLCSFIRTSGGNYAYIVEIAGGQVLFSGDADPANDAPTLAASIETLKLTAPTEITLTLGLLAALPSNFKAEAWLAYSSPA